MSEHAQIDVRKGKQVVKIHHGWGLPKLVIPTFRYIAGKECTGVRSVANGYIKYVPDSSFGLSIIPEDLNADYLSYRYVLDISVRPWILKVTKCAGYRINFKDGTIGNELQPARTRTVTLTGK